MERNGVFKALYELKKNRKYTPPARMQHSTIPKTANRIICELEMPRDFLGEG
jgi:hypothetical protein